MYWRGMKNKDSPKGANSLSVRENRLELREGHAGRYDLQSVTGLAVSVFV